MISILLIITLTSFLLLGVTENEKKNWEEYTDMNFSTDFEWDSSLMDAYASQETALEASYAGPFFFGEFDGVNEYTQMYSAARNERVEDIINVMDDSIDYMNDLEDLVKNQRGTLDWYIFKIAALSPGMREVLLPYIDRGTENAIAQNLKLEFLNSLKKELSSGKKNAEWGFLTYTKYVTILDLVQSYTDEINDMNKILVTLYYILEDNNEVYQEINKELDDRLESNSLKIGELVHKLNYNSASLIHEEKLLFTADYYFAKDTVTYIEQELIKFDRKISEYSEQKEDIDTEVFDFVKGMKEKFVIYKNDLKKYLDSIPSDKLLQESEVKLEANLIVPMAYAGWGNPFTILGSAFKSATDVASSIGKAGIDMAWDTTKAIGSGVSNVVTEVVKGGVNLTIATAKTAGTVVGVGLDVVNATVKTGVDVYYASNHSERVAAIKKNYKEVATNFKEGKSGSEVYNTAVKGLEGVEIVAEQVIAGVTSHLLGGPGYTSQTLGFLAKVGVGFFTGLAKDSYTILNPQASTADTMMAIGSMFMTFVGGSQSVMKGSQALNITKTVGKETLKKAGKLSTKYSLNTAKGWFKGGFVATLKRSLSRSSLKTVGKKSAEVMVKTKNTLVKKSKDGLSYLKGNIKKEVPDAFETVFKSKKGEDGLGMAFKKLLGMATDEKTKWSEAVGLFNNFIGAIADNTIKAQAKNILVDGLSVENTKTSYWDSLEKLYEDERQKIIDIDDGQNQGEKTSDYSPEPEKEFDVSDYIVPVEDYPEVEHIFEEPTDNAEDVVKDNGYYGGFDTKEQQDAYNNFLGNDTSKDTNMEEYYEDEDWDEENIIYDCDDLLYDGDGYCNEVIYEEESDNIVNSNGFGAEDICIASGGYIDASGSCEFEYSKSSHEEICALSGGRADPSGGCIYGNEPIDSSDDNDDINWNYDCSYCHENDPTCLANCLGDAGILK